MTNGVHPAWPGSLPQLFRRSGYSSEPVDVTARFRVDQGPDLRRLRYTSQPMTYQGQMRMTPFQWVEFRRFWKEDLHHGRLAMTFPKPLASAETITARFTSPPTRRTLGADWLISMTLREE